MQVRVCVLGTVVASALQVLLRLCSEHVVLLPLPELRSIGAAPNADVLAKLDSADVIFVEDLPRNHAAPGADWYGAISTRYGSRIARFPWVRFAGYEPSLCRVRSHSGVHVRGVLDEYHIEPLLQAYRAGLSVPSAFEAWIALRPETLRRTNEGIEALKVVDKDLPIRASEVFERLFHVQKLMNTWNRPTFWLTAALIEQMVRYVGVNKSVQFPWHAFNESVWLNRIVVATHPAVHAHHGLRYPLDRFFVGTDPYDASVLRHYRPMEIVNAYYELYRSFDKEHGPDWCSVITLL